MTDDMTKNRHGIPHGIRFYKEKGKNEYLCIDPDTADHYLKTQDKLLYEGLATALSENLYSLCITSISPEYLKTYCRRIAWRKIPSDWQNQFYQRFNYEPKPTTKPPSEAC